MRCSTEPEKLVYDETIVYESHDEPFTWKDIKDLNLQDDDAIMCRWEEPYYSENNSYEGYFSLTVSREMIETDEQYAERMKFRDKRLEENKKERYERYLKMKAEFEPNNSL